MSNVVTFNAPPRQDFAARQSRLVRTFAKDRRQQDDVFWLKENAELLGILVATSAQIDRAALASFETFYEQIIQRMLFFPQYYRFLLSICLDLEDLGMAGNNGEALVQMVADKGFAQAEISDLQRAEARRLLARRAVVAADASGLDERLHQFIERSDTFALPNKKAAYELTHIVFYLSQYGQCDPGLSDKAITSLNYAGMLAYLDQNSDLLAEICTALRYAGQEPGALWQAAVAQAHAGFRLVESETGPANDAYHAYLVTGWAQQIADGTGFEAMVPDTPVHFIHDFVPQGALRAMSECMYELGDQRCGEWAKMRPHVLSFLGPDGHEVLVKAERSGDGFEAFFDSFARAVRP